MKFKFLLVLFVFTYSTLTGQTYRTVSGKLQDSVGTPIAYAQVMLIMDLDTLKTTSASSGRFELKEVKQVVFRLVVKGLGYQTFTNTYDFSKDVKNSTQTSDMSLKNIVLRTEINMLNEVIIKAKSRPIIFKEDTVEYDAGAYVVRPHDRLADLVKQLPGIDIDKDGQASMLGMQLYKIRVNGEDFFTGNVKEFLDRLPADIVSKIQVIDDHGDFAKLTKIKVDNPPKMINIVTKPGMSKGRFGDLKGVLGTNKQYGAELKGNLWLGPKQISVAGSNNSVYNGAGTVNKTTASVLNRQKPKTGGSRTLTYNFNQTNTDGQQESFTEILNPNGSIFSKNNYLNNTVASKHELKYDHFTPTGQMFFLRAVFDQGKDRNVSKINETGVSNRVLSINRSGRDFRSSVSLKMQSYQALNESGRYISMIPALSYMSSDSRNFQEDFNTYYLAGQGGAKRDSVLNRLISSKVNGFSYSDQLVFEEPLNDLKNEIRKSISFTHLPSFMLSTDAIYTSARNLAEQYVAVDSLTTDNSSVSFSERIQIAYNQTSKKLNYHVGISPAFYLISGKFDRDRTTSNKAVFKVLPFMGVTYTPSKMTTMYLKYRNSVSMPSTSQLQQVTNAVNLQNIIIGNPNLKPSIVHTLDGNYKFSTEKGYLVLLSVVSSLAADRVVDNITFLKDTLNSLKQVTRFENADGYYTANSSYSITIPVATEKYAIDLAGDAGYTHDVYFSENMKSYAKSVNLSQQIGLNANNKWLASSTSAGFGFTGNRYTLGQNKLSDVFTWSFSADAKFILSTKFSIGFVVSKVYYQGYQFEQRNPLLIHFNLERFFFKNNLVKVQIAANDILNQGNNLARITSVNSYTDYRTNQITRYFLASVLLRMDRFGR